MEVYDLEFYRKKRREKTRKYRDFLYKTSNGYRLSPSLQPAENKTGYAVSFSEQQATQNVLSSSRAAIW